MSEMVFGSREEQDRNHLYARIKELEAEIGRLTGERDEWHGHAMALAAEVERLSKMCCVCEGDCCRLAKERKVEIEQWREALSFAEGCIPAQIMLALRLSGMPESRATVGEIAAWLRAALRGGGEHSKHPTGDHCVYCRSQWPCEESGGE